MKSLMTVVFAKTLAVLLTLVIAATMTLSSPAANAAQGYTDITQKAGNNYMANPAGITAKQAAAAARNHIQGRVLSVKPHAKNPHSENRGYRVKLLVDGGRVVTVNVDGNGRVRGR